MGLLMSLDERIRQLSETLINEVRSPIESALRAVLDEVMTRAAEERDQAVQSAVAAASSAHEASLQEQSARGRSEIEAARAQFGRELDASQAALREHLEAEHGGKVAALREELDGEREAALSSAREQFARERDGALAALRAELEREGDAKAEKLRDELIQLHEAAMRTAEEEITRVHQAQLQELEAQAARDREHAESSSGSNLVHAAEAAGAAALTAALAKAEHDKHEADARISALELDLERTKADVTRAESGRQDAEAELGQSRAADRQQELACSDRTLDAFRKLDAARSLVEVFAILADHAAREIGRAAVLLVNGSRLRGLDARGFAGANPFAIDVPIDPESVFGMAIGGGLPVSTSTARLGPEGDALAATLAAPDRAGLAVPISIGGRVAAILYADDAGAEPPVVPSNWPEVAEILARHAGHCLELLTISHASVLAGRVQGPMATPASRHADASPFADDQREEESARRYARLLISEIKLYNEVAVEEGRQAGNLAARLGPEIERARRLYEEKIPAAVRQRVNCFDNEVVRTLAGGDPGLLGQS